MIYIDTNIILRILLNDNPVQTKKIKKFISTANQDLYISKLVILESFQTLTGKVLNFSHQQASQALSILFFETSFFIIEDKINILNTLKILEKNKTDFVDAYLAIITQKKDSFLSLDKGIDKISEKRINLK